ncbi:MAG TPA: tRNA (adenosine(37)-N6)-threonylcarbamoyltransferase complex ATPase subunit type 1 TsaE [Candidatus Saccharimonadales bacterium]|nr:tRNA (adenosine(37)-N6)-threonylcarbamoyltransferase complex ATPase subunit type 1 TsaE [Candidatus Saccharimonadales bacterium]
MTWQTTSISADATEQLGESLGRKLRGGETIELASDLGGGKTTFTRGLVRGTGSTDKVGSPTFTLSREYVAPHFTVAHFDFYRLGEAGIVGDELGELIGDPAYVTIVEWGDIVQNVLPHQRLTIRFDQTGDDERHITVSYPTELKYLVEGLPE